MIATFLNWEPWQSKLVEDLIRFEGFREHFYDDKTGKAPVKTWQGKLTIGVGFNIEDNGLSLELATVILKTQIEDTVKELSGRFYWFAKLSPNRKRALSNLSFNLGIGRLLGFKQALSAMEHHTFEIAAREFRDSLWYMQVGPTRGDFVTDLIREG